MKTSYTLTPLHGLPGNEVDGHDAWFVLNALAYLQTDPGKSSPYLYEIGSPLFEGITNLSDDKYFSGKKFTFQAKKSSDPNHYIQLSMPDGKVLTKTWIYHSDLVTDSMLPLVVGPSPNENWDQR